MINSIQFDGYEIHPIRFVRKDGTLVKRTDRWSCAESANIFQEAAPGDCADIWYYGVFGHYRSGGLESIADTPTQQEAWDIVRHCEKHGVLPSNARTLTPASFAEILRYSDFRVRPFKLQRAGRGSLFIKRGSLVRAGTPTEAVPCEAGDPNVFAWGLYGVLAQGQKLFTDNPGPVSPGQDSAGLEEHLMDFVEALDAERAACYARKHGVLPPLEKVLR